VLGVSNQVSGITFAVTPLVGKADGNQTTWNLLRPLLRRRRRLKMPSNVGRDASLPMAGLQQQRQMMSRRLHRLTDICQGVLGDGAEGDLNVSVGSYSRVRERVISQAQETERRNEMAVRRDRHTALKCLSKYIGG
jgi:hypothetical protein